MAAKTIETMNMFDVLQEVQEVVQDNWEDLDNSEFPALGATTTPPKDIQDTATTTKKKQANPKKVTKFIVASSYIDEMKNRRRENRPQIQQDADRTQAFTQLQDKNALAKTLICTKPCHYVLKNVDDETGEVAAEYGVCYREVCTFAHSMDELQLPPCAFGEKCTRRDGTKNFKTGKVDKDNKCQFCHPGETQDQFYTRTGRDKPDLPATSEKSRCPRPKPVKKEAPKKEAPKKEAPKKEAPKTGTGSWAKPLDKDKLAVKETVVIRVPKELAQQAMEMALTRGLTDFRIETL